MIQRIQSLFLLLAIVALLLIGAFPIAKFYSQTGIYVLNLFELESLTPDNVIPFVSWFLYPLLALVLALVVLNVVAFISFKNRVKQIKLTQIAFLLNVILIVGLLFYYIPTIEENTATSSNYQGAYSIYLPLVALIFTLLAQRFIRKDEKLVRSVDRLR